MIVISDKHKCCGCEACVNACPKDCISMTADREGFLYPRVDTSRCIDCGLCERVCPCIAPSSPADAIGVFAAKCPDSGIRHESSSGGIFTMLAEKAISGGGTVFGAAFASDWTVEHTGIHTTSDIKHLRGSKYVQSHIGQAFRQCRQALADGQQVLFSGTPCQIAGLRRLLGNHAQTDRLLTVACVCHGVPSPAVWLSYLREATGTSAVESISFRDKTDGWTTYRITIRSQARSISQPFHDNPYIRSFLSNINLRPSCFDCPAKGGRSGADIELGDFWGIAAVSPAFASDNLGVSLVIARTAKGINAISSLNANLLPVKYSDAFSENPVIEHSVNEHANRAFFFSRFAKTGFTKAFMQTFGTTFAARLRRRLFRIINPK